MHGALTLWAAACAVHVLWIYPMCAVPRRHTSSIRGSDARVGDELAGDWEWAICWTPIPDGQI
jgi:hypothetical protein